MDVNTEYKGKKITIRVPQDFICPLTKKIILDPYKDIKKEDIPAE